MDNIILNLLHIIQYQYQQICWLLNFICRYIPLKQWAFDDSHSPNYQKFKVDELPLITDFKQDWTYKELIPYFKKCYGKTVKPVQRRSVCDIPDDCSCPRCGAKFSQTESRFTKISSLRCPHCSNTLVAKKNRKFFVIHKCMNPNCPYYLHNLKKWTMNIWKKIMAKTNISYITSTLNSLWISFA